MENAFAHRLDVTPYRSGFSLVWEAFIEWIQAFNNFRVAFLVMLLHDTPITLLNFFFISSCRCAGPRVLPWSLLLSTLSSIVSLLWRITMLYFSYRRMLCPLKPKANVNITRYPKFSEHMAWAADYREGGRLQEYDEFWPVRWGRHLVYGRKPSVTSTLPGPDRSDALYEKWRPPSLLSTLPVCGTVVFPNVIISYAKKTANLATCVLLSAAGYMAFILTCCVPCLYHYTCRKHSFYHRHKCSRTLVRYCSNIFHYSVFAFSLLIALLLIALNVILLSSVHIIGANTLPPEIDRVCITLLPTSRSIHAAILPSPVFSLRPLEQNVNAVFLSSDHMASTVCKPLWEDGELGLGLRRKEAGPWQTRKQFGDRLIAVATQVILNNSIPEESYLELRFDHALLLKLGPNHDRMFGCARGEKSGWQFIAYLHHTPWPYFLGCRQNWRFAETQLIECFEDRLPRLRKKSRTRREHGQKQSMKNR
ncbi:hypothetical protein Y032_0725g1857 [Ancylostoma ceylanicum]|nr:hypothetical protein Y032_0725g1857 [Ancylostoma ceylanicum]